MKTLTIDIGGTGLKMMMLDAAGEAISPRTRVLTPDPATPEAVLEILSTMRASHPGYNRISCGFPGVVVEGVTINAPNLDPTWAGFPLSDRLTALLDAPSRVANDADVQGLGAIEGAGVELVVTLGTGVGSALFVEGRLVPNLELGHARFRKGESFEEVLGKQALKRSGTKKWRAALAKAIVRWQRLFNPRRLYLGGGHASKVRTLPEGVVTVDNREGLLGGIALWDPRA